MAPRLHFLVQESEILRLIFEEDADVNHRDVDGGTALHVARTSAVARVLILNGAEVEAKNIKGITPLHRARNVGVAKVLLENGASVNAVDERGNTPLHLCNDIETIKLLLTYSASVHARNKKGETPIHTSVYGSKVTCLAKAGADVDSVDKFGRTVLMKKSRCFYAYRLNSLLALNPSIFLKDTCGKTAIEYTINRVVRGRLLQYRINQNWRRRKTLVLLRERPAVFVTKEYLVTETVGLPMGVFRVVVAFL